MRRTLEEILGEARQLLSGRPGIADGVLPPLVFVTVNAFAGVTAAAVAGLGVAVAIVAWRLVRGASLRYAATGLVGTVIAVVIALRTGRAEDYFLPGILSGAATTLLIVASILWRRPAVAWASWVARGWPLEWYWHPRVRPAYTLASWLWAAFFGVRTGVQAWLFAEGEVEALGVVRASTGWPGLVALLALTYILGRRRLESLQGPSVEELERGDEPPWEGQTHGF